MTIKLKDLLIEGFLGLNEADDKPKKKEPVKKKSKPSEPKTEPKSEPESKPETPTSGDKNPFKVDAAWDKFFANAKKKTPKQPKGRRPKMQKDPEFLKQVQQGLGNIGDEPIEVGDEDILPTPPPLPPKPQVPPTQTDPEFLQQVQKGLASTPPEGQGMPKLSTLAKQANIAPRKPGGQIQTKGLPNAYTQMPMGGQMYGANAPTPQSDLMSVGQTAASQAPQQPQPPPPPPPKQTALQKAARSRR